MKSHSREFKLSNGRTVSLESLRQWSTYAGLLEGLPTRQRNDEMVKSLIEEERGAYDRAVLLIAPKQEQIEYDGGSLSEDHARLPAVACIAHLRSHYPTRDQEKLYSSLTLVWFQDDYAFPLSEQAESEILQVDWESLAQDHDW